MGRKALLKGIVTVAIAATVFTMGKMAFPESLAPIHAYAANEEVTVDGIRYQISNSEGNQCEITHQDSGTVKGSITIPNTISYNGKEYTVTSIVEGAFYGQDIHEISLPETITRIGTSAFGKNKNLKSIVIPKSVTSMGYTVFSDCTSLESIVIPESVTSIESAIFSGCTSLKSVVIPSSVKSIGNSVFSGCTSLESIVIPKSVTSLGGGVFAGCTSLEKVEIPASDSFYYSNYFDNKNSLKHLTIHGNGKTVIEPMSTTVLEKVQLDGVKTIGRSGFSGCKSLKRVVITDDCLETISEAGFNGCSNLKDFDLPSSVTKIDTSAFYECTSLPLLDISHVKYIGNVAFYGTWGDDNTTVTGPIDITIPSGLTGMESSIFAGCNLGTVKLGPNAIKWDEKVNPFSGAKIKHLKIKGDGITSEIPKLAFAGVASLESVEITGVKVIGEEAFRRVNKEPSPVMVGTDTGFELGWYEDPPIGTGALKRVVISDDVEKIEKLAFEGCEALEEVIIPQSVTEVGENVFENCPANVYYYADNDYKNMDSWGAKAEKLKAFCKVSVNSTNGTIKLSGTSSAANIAGKDYYLSGDVIILSAEPENGYVLDSFVVKDSKGKEITVSDSKFTMPGSSVTVSATYKKALVVEMVSDIDDQNYDDGKEIKPSVVVKDGSVVLTEGKDYLVEYLNNKAAGTAKIIVKGIGEYLGTVEKTFEIKKEEQEKEQTEEQENKQTEEQPSQAESSTDNKQDQSSENSQNSSTQTTDPSSDDKQPSEGDGQTSDNNTPSDNKDNSSENNNAVENDDNTAENGDKVDETAPEQKKTPAKVGAKVTDSKTKAKYVVTSNSAKGATVAYKASTKANVKSVTIPKTVKIDGVTYKVTSIAKNAFKGNETITSIKIGSNVKTIGNNSFAGCKNLKKVVIPASVTRLGSNLFKNSGVKTVDVKTSKLKKLTIAKNAFKGLSTKATVKVPKKKKDSYTKIFRSRGLSKKVTIK